MLNRPAASLLAAEKAHHLQNPKEVGRKDDDVEKDIKFCAKFDVLAGQHGRKMQARSLMVKEIESSR